MIVLTPIMQFGDSIELILFSVVIEYALLSDGFECNVCLCLCEVFLANKALDLHKNENWVLLHELGVKLHAY